MPIAPSAALTWHGLVRVVLDTNTVVSGFLWGNQPRALIEAAINERIELFTCGGLIEELAGILPRQKFSRRLAEKQLSIPALIASYGALAEIIEPALLAGTDSTDPDDDLVLATPIDANAELIVSRDKHLRNLKHFHRIPILNATEALHRIEQQTRHGISR